MKVFPEKRQLFTTIAVTLGIIVGTVVAVLLGLMYPLLFWFLLIMVLGLLAFADYRRRNGKEVVAALREITVNFSRFTNKYAGVAALIAIVMVSYQSYLLWSENNWEKEATKAACTSADVVSASNSVVLLEGKTAVGTGFLISPEQIITNNHVVDHNQITAIRSIRGDLSVGAKVIATDSLRDIAIIQLPGPTSLSPLSFTDHAVNLLDEVYAIGYPFGKNLTISRGIVTAVTGDDYDDRQYIQTDAAIVPGNSGGPLVDRCGRVVGMNTQTVRGEENIGYALDYNQLSARITAMIDSIKTASLQERESSYPSEQAEVVAKYYTTLGAGEVEEAYAFYAKSRQARLPLENWRIGLERTLFIRLISVELTGRPNTVKVHFYATERKPDDPWTWVTSEFEGTWTLVRETGLWKMDESNIKLLKVVDEN